MRQAEVYLNGVLAGMLAETDNSKYVFRYADTYLMNESSKAISLSLPKRREEYVSDELFPFFYNMLSEGTNKAIQCQTLRIDEDDAFGLLLATAGNDTIGAVTVKKL
ncbi:HipA N-terminal domain-containing protein [Bacteroides sp. UBA939]|uniref:HipA N-terminal domain-containing protein n=1 Tax=Bacteroides sp. UBA939 TaxID=1946092 RepID=UPI0025C5EB43|nr:HipA N-terminal domain-containing protein [Bacteroides sp. UBA939]